MTPASVVGVTVFFLLIIPGITYELLRRRVLLPIEESGFVQVSRILLSGTIIFAIVVLLLVAVRSVSPRALLNPGAFIGAGSAYAESNLGLIGKTMGFYVLLAVLLAVVASDLNLGSKQVKIHRGAAIIGLTEIDKRPEDVAWLAVHLKSGKEILGYYYGATTELDPDKRELILQKPLRVGYPEKGEPAHMASDWKRVLIHVREIEYLSVAYVAARVVPSETISRKLVNWMRDNFLRAKVCAPLALVAVAGFALPWP
ncbi:hypothetical protein B0I33_105534 [Prauserella shujinwangii]|uniref:Uncharacterized protein n=1 Tax=Prauserella shujinwangii TaxID=1453103 RepID=A0A2T0LVZ4_9PSEU|nr:DUF6338 family protein [Prauserella shujinwangii]PRX47949.1 hypothetical protein B0I33_105534 [Prauserella shujinwangii]